MNGESREEYGKSYSNWARKKGEVKLGGSVCGI
jgi:hypothetical protein